MFKALAEGSDKTKLTNLQIITRIGPFSGSITLSQMLVFYLTSELVLL
jgi:hypothetical protein